MSIGASGVTTFALHFSGFAWSQIGSLDAAEFEALQQTLEQFAHGAAERLRLGFPPTVDGCVPIVARALVAECQFDDFARAITVNQLERWGRMSGAV